MNYREWINGNGCCQPTNNCGCGGKDVCDCEEILLEISKLHTDDEILQDEIDDVAESLSGYATEQWVEEQGYLKTVEPLKTINGESLIGEGNIVISGGSGGTIAVDDHLDSASTNPVANSAITEALNGKLDASAYTPTEQVQSDWNVTDSASTAYIKNKPVIPVVPTNVSYFTNDADYAINSEVIQYITNLQEQINSLVATISGCCGQTGETQYRWVTMTGENDYLCSGTTKYSKEKEQSSTDGINWVDTGNIRSGSTVLEENSTDCGYSGTGSELIVEYYGGSTGRNVFIYKDDSVIYENEVDNDAISVAASSEVTEVNANAFKGYQHLNYVSFGDYSRFVVPDQDADSKLTAVGDYAFSGCTALTYVSFARCKTTPPTLGVGVFDGCTSLQHLYVRTTMVDAFKSAWPQYSSLITGI